MIYVGCFIYTPYKTTAAPRQDNNPHVIYAHALFTGPRHCTIQEIYTYHAKIARNNSPTSVPETNTDSEAGSSTNATPISAYKASCYHSCQKQGSSTH
jgi:hypothetical protein